MAYVTGMGRVSEDATGRLPPETQGRVLSATPLTGVGAIKAATRCLGVIALALTAQAATAQFYDWDPGLLDEIRYRGLLKVGVGMFEPWVMCDANGDLIGFEVDVARRLAEDLEVRIQFVRTDWYYIVPALIEEEFDLEIPDDDAERMQTIGDAISYVEEKSNKD